MDTLNQQQIDSIEQGPLGRTTNRDDKPARTHTGRLKEFFERNAVNGFLLMKAIGRKMFTKPLQMRFAKNGGEFFNHCISIGGKSNA